MSSTITTTITSGITLGTSGAYTSPLTIAGTGAVEASTGVGILGPSTASPTPWTIDNQGTITAPGDGIRLLMSGSVANAGGLIRGSTGIYITGTVGSTGAVLNSRTIIGTTGDGVQLMVGGYVDNTAGLIEGTYGVYIAGTTGTVINAGDILGTTGRGVDFKDGGSISNTGTIDGTIDGIYVTGRAGTVTNSGTIQGIGTAPVRQAIDFYAGGTVTNNTGGIILGTGAGIYIGDIGATGSTTGTVINSSTIEGTGGAGVNLHVSSVASVNNSGLIEGFGGVYVVTGTGTVTNSGTIIATGGSFGSGVVLDAGGSVSNTGGAIRGNVFGVQIAGGAGTVTNSGLIAGTTSSGVILQQGGSITNNPGDLIQGSSFGAYIYGAAATVTNSGKIASTGTGDGIRMKMGGSVSNTGTVAGQTIGVYIFGGAGTVSNSGTITGAGLGVDLFAAGGTVINSGTISGGNGTAVYFGGTGGSLLVLEHGYSLSGSVKDASTTNTLELLGTAGAVTVDFEKAGAGFTNFATAAFGAPSGNSETLKISDTTALPGTIAGFTAYHEIVDLTQLSPVGATATLNGSDQLVVSNGSQSVSLQLDPSGTYTGVVWVTGTDSGSGTDVSVACFCRGTLILTERGEVAVEDLAIGDRVITVSGAAKPIKWIGRRSYDGRMIAGNRAILPIRIAAGAIDDGVPRRDLFLSPEHALYINGALVPARRLVNGFNVTQAEAVERLDYLHIELEGHDILVAEGAAAESYVECNNRGMFQNRAEFARLYPDDARPREFCAPRLEDAAPEATAIRARLLARAEGLGYGLTEGPDPHLVIAGRVVPPQSVSGTVYRFGVAAGTDAVWLASRSAVPAEVDAASQDGRRLGACIERILIYDADLRIEVGHRHPALCDGFHEAETTHRWTTGLARLPEALLQPFAGDFTVELHLIPSELRYPPAAPENLSVSPADDESLHPDPIRVSTS